MGDGSKKVGSVFTYTGADFGGGESYSIHWVIDPKTNKVVQITPEQAAELNRRAVERERWGKALLIDYKMATTKGAEQKGWQKAHRYLQLGRL